MQKISYSSFFLGLGFVFVVLFYFLTSQLSMTLYLFFVCVNAMISILEIFTKDDAPFSLHKIVNFFFFFFFILANFIQYASNSIVTTLNVNFSGNDYLMFQIVVFVIIGVFNLSYKFFYQHKKGMERSTFNVPVNNTQIKETLLLFISSAALFYVFFHFNWNVQKLLFRGLENDIYSVVGNDLLFGKFIRPLPFVCTMIAYSCKLSPTVSRLLLLEMLVCLFPLSLSRNAVAMYWLPVFLVVFDVFYKKNFFTFVFLFGLIVLFPFLNNFRYYNGSVRYSLDFSFLNSLHFDAAQEFMYVLQNDIVLFGKQLLGVLFFFVPRSFWPSKPIGSGAYLAEQQHVFSNISMPYFGEGYINFGFVGIFLFTVLLSLFSAKMDKKFWCGLERSSYFTPIYLILIGSMLFILRGDLMSSFAYTTGTLCAYTFVFFVARKI